MMRGTDETSGSLFSYVDLEARIPAKHPLRKIRQLVNEALAGLDTDFQALYTNFGRPSFTPERLIRQNHPARGACPVDQAPQIDRRSFRLCEDRRGHGTDRLPRPRTVALPLHLYDGRDQPRPTTSAAGRVTMANRVKQSCFLLRGAQSQARTVVPGRSRSTRPLFSAAC